jgi:hypothetical protein
MSIVDQPETEGSRPFWTIEYRRQLLLAVFEKLLLAAIVGIAVAIATAILDTRNQDRQAHLDSQLQDREAANAYSTSFAQLKQAAVAKVWSSFYRLALDIDGFVQGTTEMPDFLDHINQLEETLIENGGYITLTYVKEWRDHFLFDLVAELSQAAADLDSARAQDLLDEIGVTVEEYLTDIERIMRSVESLTPEGEVTL